jgi:ATP-binding cassette subfamily B protein
MSDLKRLNPYFKQYRYLIWPGLIFCVISAVLSVIVPMQVRYAVDAIPRMVTHYELFKGTPAVNAVYGEAMWGLFVFGMVILIISTLSGLFLFLMRQTLIVASRHIEYELRNSLFEQLQRLSPAWYINNPTGDVMTRLTNDIEQVRQYVGPAIMYAARSIVLIVVALVTMLAISPSLTAYSLIPMPILAVTIFFMAKVVHSRSEAIQKQYSVLTSRAQEAFSGIRVLKAYARESYESEQFNEESLKYNQRNMDLVKVESLFRPIFVVLIGMAVIIVVWAGGYQYAQGRITVGNIAEFIIYVTIMTWPVASFGVVINMMQRARASMKRLNAILDQEPDIKDTDITDASIQKIRGAISFKDVSFRYKENDPLALDHVSFKIEAGKTLAIVGRTGSGKTTLSELILRLYDANSGSVMIDGHDIRTIPLDTLRQSASYVSQDVFLFSDSLANNIAFGKPEAEDEIIRKAAHEADLLENIEGFDEGFETMVGERGIALSGGQKQRTSIARALIREPNILILDDALSAVDTETEATILGSLRQHYGKRTVVIVSHRISAVQDADLILVMDEGRITQSGTHDELLDLGGLYADLYTKQLLEEEIAAIG